MTQSWQQPDARVSASAMKVNRTLPAAPGIALILVGVVALAVQMDWIALSELWRFWPVALILSGVSQLLDWRKEQA